MSMEIAHIEPAVEQAIAKGERRQLTGELWLATELARLAKELIRKNRVWEKEIRHTRIRESFFSMLKHEGIIGKADVFGVNGEKRISIGGMSNAHPLRAYSDAAARRIADLCCSALSDGRVPTEADMGAIRNAVRHLSSNGYVEESRRAKSVLDYKPDSKADGKIPAPEHARMHLGIFWPQRNGRGDRNGAAVQKPKVAAKVYAD